jgi:hypothetical protein
MPQPGALFNSLSYRAAIVHDGPMSAGTDPARPVLAVPEPSFLKSCRTINFINFPSSEILFAWPPTPPD